MVEFLSLLFSVEATHSFISSNSYVLPLHIHIKEPRGFATGNKQVTKQTPAQLSRIGRAPDESIFNCEAFL